MKIIVQYLKWKFKWKTKAKLKLPETFTKTYNAETKIIDRKNFREFVVIKQLILLLLISDQ